MYTFAIYMYMHIIVYHYIYIYMYLYISVCVCVRACVRACVRVCVCVHAVLSLSRVSTVIIDEAPEPWFPDATMYARMHA